MAASVAICQTPPVTPDPCELTGPQKTRLCNVVQTHVKDGPYLVWCLLPRGNPLLHENILCDRLKAALGNLEVLKKKKKIKHRKPPQENADGYTHPEKIKTNSDGSTTTTGTTFVGVGDEVIDIDPKGGWGEDPQGNPPNDPAADIKLATIAIHEALRTGHTQSTTVTAARRSGNSKAQKRQIYENALEVYDTSLELMKYGKANLPALEPGATRSEHYKCLCRKIKTYENKVALLKALTK